MKTGSLSLKRIIVKLFILAAAAGMGGYSWHRITRNQTIEALLVENTDLKAAISNLTAVNRIGYAKVTNQEVREGRLFTKLLFVATDPEDESKRILEKEYEIEGDVVHFDALVVKFGKEIVMDGTERSMYLWRRIYGEKMPPEQGFPIEIPDKEPRRYADICRKLSVTEKNLFWSEIWKLSNNPEALSKSGITAIYGNGIYQKLKPGLIYVFKISSDGEFYPETIPDL